MVKLNIQTTSLTTKVKSIRDLKRKCITSSDGMTLTDSLEHRVKAMMKPMCGLFSLFCITSIPTQPRVEAKPETQTAPLRPRDQRTRDRPAFTPRGPRPGNADTNFPD